MRSARSEEEEKKSFPGQRIDIDVVVVALRLQIFKWL